MIKRRRSRGAGAAAVREDTRARILDAAERLFAERGFDAVSVRSILEAAHLNVALAHYHFGSREGLVAELLRTRVQPLVDAQLRGIAEADARGAAAGLEDVLRACFVPVARWMVERPQAGRLFGQLHASPSPELRALGEELARPMLQRLAAALVPRLPAPLAPEQVFLRFMLAIAGPIYLSNNWERVLESARRHVSPEVRLDPERIAEELVVFAAAGLRAAGGAAWGKP